MATYYQGSGGNDSNDGLSWGNRFATMQKLFDTCTAGDTGYFQGETVSSTVDIDTNTGTSDAPIIYHGCDSSGNALSGSSQATIDTSSTLANGVLHASANTPDYLIFKQMKVDGGGSGNGEYCVQTADSDSHHAWTFVNCRFTNADNHGLYIRAASPWTFVNCQIDNNGAGGSGNGILPTNNARGSFNLINCRIHDNADAGARIGYSSSNLLIVKGCVFYDNGDVGLYCGATTNYAIICNNVFFKNSSDGIYFSSGNDTIILYNNIFRINGGYGINSNNDIDHFVYMDYNCSHVNTSGHWNLNGGTLFGSNNVTSDPKFTSETDGSEDFTLQSDSPCIDAGFGYNG